MLIVFLSKNNEMNLIFQNQMQWRTLVPVSKYGRIEA